MDLSSWVHLHNDLLFGVCKETKHHGQQIVHIRSICTLSRINQNGYVLDQPVRVSASDHAGFRVAFLDYYLVWHLHEFSQPSTDHR
jgi:hypothetical protein